MSGDRIAFLTPEFVSEYSTGGGLGNYLNRISQQLCQLGYEVHVFVSSTGVAACKQFNGVVVHLVPPVPPGRFIRSIALAARRLWASSSGKSLSLALRQALALQKACDQEERQGGDFIAVQSSDYLFPGLFVTRRPGRKHVIRCSSASDLYAAIDRLDFPEPWWRWRLELLSLRRADCVYAPSRFVAHHYRDTLGLTVHTLRPPLFCEAELESTVSFSLPPKYFLYFGQLFRRKGIDVLAQALPLVWEQAPDFTMVWAGADFCNKMNGFREMWGAHAAHVQFLGAVEKPILYHILRAAEVAVLPSLVDNLPNTVMEALLMGIPVIGTKGASIDELVRDGVEGTLVPPGDVGSLATSLIDAWKSKVPWRKGFVWDSAIKRELEPETAADTLVRLFLAHKDVPVRDDSNIAGNCVRRPGVSSRRSD